MNLSQNFLVTYPGNNKTKVIRPNIFRITKQKIRGIFYNLIFIFAM